MKENRKTSCRKVRRCARPINLSNGNRRVVLCLHGFTGYPGEMAYPASRLAEAGWDVRVPRITGHGTDGDDFMASRPKDWRRQIRDEWLNLTSLYDTVHVLGHSMGGLLTLDLARRYPVVKAAIMAPAIGIRTPGQFLLEPLSLFIRKSPFAWKTDPRYVFFDDRDEDDEAYLGAEYWSWVWMKQIALLRRVMKSTERALGEIQTPMLGIFGGKDSVVGQNGLPFLQKHLKGPFETLKLEECGHYIPYDPNPGMKEAAMDAVIAWFGN